uniref:Uncharacterized protein n=1 Tax=Hyaloperonospora arabidopsidis (strain Emoy2) TaxID=559515 RepID=M4B6W8_HYAAE
MHLKSATILEAAVNYARMYGNTGAIQSCLLFSIASALLRASGDEKRDDGIHSEAGSSRAAFDKRLGSEADRTIRELIYSTSSDKLVARCEKATSAYLNKLEVFVASSFESLRLPGFSVYAPFVMRCLKRSSISMYNYGLSAQHSTSDQLRHQVVTR